MEDGNAGRVRTRARGFLPGAARGLTLEPELYDGRPDLVAALQGFGETVTRAPETQSAAQVIGIDWSTSTLSGGADARRDGSIASP